MMLGVLLDWVPDGVADVCAEAGGRGLDWGAHGSREDGEDEWYVLHNGCLWRDLLDG